MVLSTAKYLADPRTAPARFNSETGWQGVRGGLRLVSRGYLVLIAGAALGLFFTHLASDDSLLADRLRVGRADRDTLLLLGVLSFGPATLFSYALVLLGQWHCLMYAPQRQNAKELMYVCLYCVLLGSVLNALGGVLGGARVYEALLRGPDEFAKLDVGRAGPLLLLGSVALALVGSLVFSQFLRNVACCFADRPQVRSVDLNLTFVGLLLGATIGVLFCLPHLASRAGILPWLALGWLLCFAWHVNLVRGVRRCVEGGLRDAGVSLAPEGGLGVLATHTLSGMYRLARRDPARAEPAGPAQPEVAADPAPTAS
jgi:hypothetical protein